MEAIYLFVGTCTFWLAVWACVGHMLSLLFLAVMYILKENLNLKERFEWSENALDRCLNGLYEFFFDNENVGLILRWLFPAILGPIFYPIALLLVFGEILLVHPFRAHRQRAKRSEMNARNRT